MKQYKFFIFIFTISLTCFSQNETNIWYFGSAGLDFNSGVPVPLTNSAMLTTTAGEGTAVAVDRNTGALLFYSNGANVWDRNHTWMPGANTLNALNGHPSSVQSSLVVPKPCSDSLFYLFTTDAIGTDRGLHYSLIDMSLNGGNGDIVPGTLNTLLLAPTCEKLAGVHHANGRDIWVATIEYQTNNIYLYLVTPGGISAPVVTSIGHNYSGAGANTASRAQLKFSVDGQRLLSAIGTFGISELFDFNNTTGVVSNRLTVDTMFYGATFSQNGQFVYAARQGPTGAQVVNQYDITSGNSATIKASRITLGTIPWPPSPTQGLPGSFQIGIDGKIYIANGNSQPFIHVINNPNVAGLGCNFVQNSLLLAGQNSSYGLPNFIESYFDPNYAYVSCSFQATTSSTSANCKTPCTGTATATPTGGTAPFIYSWNTVPVQTTQTATGLCAGSYTVTVTETNSGTTVTSVVTVNQNAATPILTAGPTLQLNCNNNSGQIYVSSNPAQVNFSWAGPGIISGNGTDTVLVNLNGTYTVIATDTATGCSDTTTVLVTKDTLRPNVTVGANTTLTCIKNTDTLSATSTTTGVTYNWFGSGVISGSTTSNPIINTPGTYTVVVTNPINGCKDSSTVTVTSNIIPPHLSTGASVTLTSCLNITDTITATSNTPNVIYNWLGPGIVSGGTTSQIIINTPGTYTVIVTDPTNGCTKTDSVLVTINAPLPNILTQGEIMPCNQNTDTLNATSTTANVTYSWSGPGIVSGGTSSNPIINTAGTYTVIVTDPITGCTNSATATVTITPGPTASISPTSIITLLQGDSTTVTASGGVIYNWYPTTGLNNSNSNVVIVKPNQSTIYCVEVIDNKGCKDTTCVTINIEAPCPTKENLQVPNAFSPNGDNINDEFCLQGWTPCVEAFEIFIFNRWGEKIYESKDPNFCWDGKYGGVFMDAQVFVYYLKANYTNIENTIVKKGNITLLK